VYDFLKVPKCENFDLLFFTLINNIWVGDRGTGIVLLILKTEADIHHFMFFKHAECGEKKFYACRVCAKKCSTHAEYAAKNVLRMLIMR
jgi:hypothetical protein